jgi:hypothetical protein
LQKIICNSPSGYKKKMHNPQTNPNPKPQTCSAKKLHVTNLQNHREKQTTAKHVHLYTHITIKNQTYTQINTISLHVFPNFHKRASYIFLCPFKTPNRDELCPNFPSDLSNDILFLCIDLAIMPNIITLLPDVVNCSFPSKSAKSIIHIVLPTL